MIDWKDLRNLDAEDLLKIIGLQRRRDFGDWMLPAIGFFGAGLLIGTGLGLLVAPKPGRELREDVKSRLQVAPESVRSGLSSPTSEKSRQL
jgi:hypothetical protein